MKIGVDIRVLMDEQYSGVSEYAARLLQAILEQDRQSEFRFFYNSWHDLSRRLNSWERPNARLVGTRWPNKLFNYGLQKGLSYPKLDRLLDRPEIFWAPHFNFSSLEPATKFVLTVHDLSFLRYPQYFSWRQNIWHRALAVKKQLQRASALVAVSANTRNDIIELAGIDPAKVHLIYAGCNEPAAVPDEAKRAELLRTLGVRCPYILYVGNIEPRKNIAGLIAAFDILKEQSRAKDYQLILAGAAGWKNRGVYKAYEQSPFKRDIRFLGYIEAAAKEALYAEATAFAYPSFYEGFGFPPLEALSRGVPVVCSQVSSLPEVVGEAAVLINPESPQDIAQGLLEIISDPELASDLKEAGRRQALRFSWQQVASEYLRLFSSL